MKIDRIVQCIENNYGIKVDDYKVVPRLMFRESLRIKSNERQYVVKKYPLATDSACLADMVELYAELERCGVTTNKVLRSEAGAPVFELPDGKYVIFTFVPGVTVNAGMVNELLFQTISEIHGRTKNILWKETKLPDDSTESSFVPSYAWDEIDNLTERVNGSVQLLQKIDQEYDRAFRNREQIIIHGDCTLNNIVVSNGSFYLIDFDNYRLGFPEEDFANLLNSILYSTADSEVKSEAMQSARSYFHGIENSVEFVYKVKLCMQKNASRELYKHKENYRYLRRTPGTVQYLHGLLDIIYRVEESDFIL